jgi:hypothetical protein
MLRYPYLEEMPDPGSDTPFGEQCHSAIPAWPGDELDENGGNEVSYIHYTQRDFPSYSPYVWIACTYCSKERPNN